MNHPTPLIASIFVGLIAFSVHGPGHAGARNEKYIAALIAAPALVVYGSDGAADATVMEIGANISGKVIHPLRSVRAIVKLGPRAIPLLIEHLDDARLTAARSSDTKSRVALGYICLDILTSIIKAPRILRDDCADDGLGACVQSGYNFRPDALARPGRQLFAPPEVKQIKRNWQRAYRSGYIKYQYPAWGRRGL